MSALRWFRRLVGFAWLVAGPVLIVLLERSRCSGCLIDITTELEILVDLVWFAGIVAILIVLGSIKVSDAERGDKRG
jgi:hypothetical protein